MKFSEKMKDCPMHEDGDCAIRCAVKVAKTTTGQKFQDVECIRENCPGCFVASKMKILVN